LIIGLIRKKPSLNILNLVSSKISSKMSSKRGWEFWMHKKVNYYGFYIL